MANPLGNPKVHLIYFIREEITPRGVLLQFGAIWRTQNYKFKIVSISLLRIHRKFQTAITWTP